MLNTAEQLSIFNVSPVQEEPSNLIPFPTRKYDSITTPIKTQAAVVIKDKETLQAIKSALMQSSKKYGLRNYVIFTLGINCGLRCGDLLQIRLQDLWDFSKQELLPKMHILEEKTHKRRDIAFSEEVAEILTEYILSIKNKKPYTPLFPSQKTQAKASNGVKDNTGCLSRKSYWKILNDIAKALEIEHLSTHSIRKSWAYATYEHYKGQLVAGQYSALDVLQQLLNHSSSDVTLRYIGLTEEVHDEVYKTVVL